MRASTKGSQKRARGGAYCKDVRDDLVNDDEAANDKCGPAGPNGEDDDTREQKKREAITETMQKRLLKKRPENSKEDRRAARQRNWRTRMMKSKPRLREYCLDGVDLLGILAITFSFKN